jgi:CBS domain-containing protein
VLDAALPIESVRQRIWSHDPAFSHQGFPVLQEGRLVGVVTRRDLTDPMRPGDESVGSLVSRPPSVVFERATLREAADHMIHENVGRLVVVDVDDPSKLVGIISRSDLLAAHVDRLAQHRVTRGSRGGRGQE